VGARGVEKGHLSALCCVYVYVRVEGRSHGLILKHQYVCVCVCVCVCVDRTKEGMARDLDTTERTRGHTECMHTCESMYASSS